MANTLILTPQQRLEALAAQYETLRQEAKALEAQSKAASKEIMTLAKEHGLFVKGDDGKERLFTEVATYTLTRRITETFMDAFKAYRVLKLINLRTLARVITLDKGKMQEVIRDGLMTEEQYASLVEATSVSEFLTPGRPAKR